MGPASCIRRLHDGHRPSRQRDMMVESAEVIVQLLRGEVVSRETDWFRSITRDCSCGPTRQRDRTGRGVDRVAQCATLAAGSAVPSILAATDPADLTPSTQLGHFVRVSQEHGNPIDRNVAVVASMHLAPTERSPARDGTRHVDAVRIFRGMSNISCLGRPRRPRRSPLDHEGLPCSDRTSARR